MRCHASGQPVLVAEKAAVKTRDTPLASSATPVVDMEPPLEEGEKATIMESSMKFLDLLRRAGQKSVSIIAP